MKRALPIIKSEIKEVSKQVSFKMKHLIDMKKLAGILLIVTAVIFSSCYGPIGPVGPPGEDGGLEYATIYDIEGDFTSGNNYNFGFVFPNGGIYETDVVLVYILWEVVDGLEVWRLCPQTVVDDEGVIQYNFDYTYQDVQVFLEFTVPESSLRSAETNNQVFRIAVVPADFAALKSVDVSNINTILQYPGIELKLNPKVMLDTSVELEIK